MNKIILTLIVLFTITTFGYSECDYIAMIAQNGHTVGEYQDWFDNMDNYDDADDYFKFLQNTSDLYDNNDGYGIGYYDTGGQLLKLLNYYFYNKEMIK